MNHSQALPLQADQTRVSSDQVRQLARSLVAARQNKLLKRPIENVLKQLERVIERWLHPDSTFRRRAEAELPTATGFSPQMIRHGLPLMLEPLRGHAIGELLDAELGNRKTLNVISGPALILHVISGNIPALAAAPVALSLAVRSAVMVKVSQTEGIFSSLFLKSISDVDPDIGACTAAVYWKGGSLGVESVAFSSCDLVVAYGNEATIADIARRVPGRFIGHGHRISLAVISREALVESRSVAAQLAYDVAMWDQQGCLSPQLAYVESGGSLAADRFAEEVGQELERLGRKLPSRALTLEDQAAIRRFRQAAEWRGVRGEEVCVFASPGGLGWTVVYDGSPTFLGTPLNRTIWVKPLKTPSDLPSLLSPARRYLEAAGIAAPPNREAKLTTLLSNAGVHRVCRIGRMQHPDLRWQQGGRSRVAEWLESTTA